MDGSMDPRAATTQNVFDFIVEIGIAGPADSAADHDDVLNQP